MYRIILALVIVVVGLVATIVAIVFFRRRQEEARRRNTLQAQEQFRRHREHLEAKFVQLAGASGKPRGLAWVRVDFENDVQFARDRHSGELCALVGITIGFEAIEGGGMEDVEAVSNLRAATAVFLFVNQQWDTLGRAIFNLDPQAAIRHFDHDMEVVE